MWLYNFPVESSKRIIEKLGRVSEWQSARAGLAHHLLSQKLGLFQHTQARDIQPSAKVCGYLMSLTIPYLLLMYTVFSNHTHIHPRTHTHTHAHTHAQTHAHTHTHTRTHTHTACSQALHIHPGGCPPCQKQYPCVDGGEIDRFVLLLHSLTSVL